jgi:hypothetical protein|tara:strand:- start:46 stop:651 length:606 start_codon:yes stop_codon:yes gene_type:complete
MKILSNNQITKNIKDIKIIDNFFSRECLLALRYRMIFNKFFDKKYDDYTASHYYPNQDYITDKIVEELNKKIDLPQFQRGWSFLYFRNAKGVPIHCDPSVINMNVWVSSDQSVADVNKNGLNIYRILPPSNWSRKDWNGNPLKAEKYIKNNSVKPVKIPYKSNRAIFFNGAYFHETNEVSMKPGVENMRVSYTLLFGNNLE